MSLAACPPWVHREGVPHPTSWGVDLLGECFLKERSPELNMSSLGNSWSLWLVSGFALLLGFYFLFVVCYCFIIHSLITKPGSWIQKWSIQCSTVGAVEVNVYLLFIFMELLNTLLDLPAIWLALSVCAYTNKKCYFFPVPAAFGKQLFSMQITLGCFW